MLYLVTGGAGFIGSHLAWNLAKRGDRVRLLDNFDTGSPQTVQALLAEFGSRVEVIDGDIRDKSACQAACAGTDFVLHHAAMASVPRSIDDPEECTAVNIGGTVCLLSCAKAAGTVRRVIFASSSAVYGDVSDAPKREDDRLDPLSPYASSKLAGEYFCRNFSSLLDLETVCFRYFNVFGERQNPNGAYAAVIPKFIEAIAAHKSPVIYGDGEQTRDFVFVDDVVAANLRACEVDASVADGSAFNVGSGVGTSLNDLVAELSRIVGRQIDVQYAPARLGDIRISVARIDRAQARLGIAPKVSVHEGIRRMLGIS